MDSTLRPPLVPMLARLERELPSDGYLYEPKWDGLFPHRRRQTACSASRPAVIGPSFSQVAEGTIFGLSDRACRAYRAQV